MGTSQLAYKELLGCVSDELMTQPLTIKGNVPSHGSAGMVAVAAEQRDTVLCGWSGMKVLLKDATPEQDAGPDGKLEAPPQSPPPRLNHHSLPLLGSSLPPESL